MNIKQLAGLVLALFISTAIFAQQSTPEVNPDLVNFQKAEPEYKELLKELKQVEKQRKDLLERMAELDAKQKQMVALTEKLETLYDGLNASAPPTKKSKTPAPAGALTKQIQAAQVSFNVQYQQLQQEMQNESRNFSAVTGVIKTKHDTAKKTVTDVR